jgi:hypothetical protein
MKHKCSRALLALVTLLSVSQILIADELTETNRQNIDNNKGRIGTIESQIVTNRQNIDLNTQMIGINGAAISGMQQQLNEITPPPIYDFKDYSASVNVSEKVFRMKGLDCGDTEVRKYVRTPQNGATSLTVTRLRSKAGIPCQYRIFDYVVDDQSRRLLSMKKYNASGSTLKSTTTISDPFDIHHNSMQVGQSWGGGSEVILSPEPVYGAVHVLANESSLLKVEDITVPYNGGTTFTGCLKIGTLRTSDTIGHFMRVEWFCPNIGMVKRIQNTLTSPPIAVVWELSGVSQ